MRQFTSATGRSSAKTSCGSAVSRADAWRFRCTLTWFRTTRTARTANKTAPAVRQSFERLTLTSSPTGPPRAPQSTAGYAGVMANSIELGLDTFGDVTLDDNGQPRSQAQALRDVVTEAVLAEQVGVNCFGVGEHHRPDFAISAPEVILAAIASKTSRMTLGSAVTVLSTDDPVRVFQRFSTLNAISNGRAEVILGRGSFTESYPLFGYDMSLYERLFEEKLEIFAALLKGGPVTWSGTTRSALKNQI